MRIAQMYSHLNAREYLTIHRPSTLAEVEEVVQAADTEHCVAITRQAHARRSRYQGCAERSAWRRPAELVERCVLALTERDDWVLDPYCGAGSALIAAIKHERKAIGADKEPEYVSIARDRIELFYAGELSVRPMGKPVYEPTGREKVAQVPIEWLTGESGAAE